jgi:hypothetical protein
LGFSLRKLQSPVRRRRGGLRLNEVANVVVRLDHVTQRHDVIRPDGDSGTNPSVRREKNMRSDMLPLDSARPTAESISNGPAFELKRIAESVVERRWRGCSLDPRTEDPGSWKCSWCGRANVRQHAGLDHCSACNAEAFTYFTFEKELHVQYSRRPLRLSDRAVRFNFNGSKGV